MEVFQSKVLKLPGTDYKEVYGKARLIFLQIKKKSKRKPYVRSAYFKKEKVFLDYYWEHLHSKNERDRWRRLKYYSCALDLIKNSKMEPFTTQHPNRRKESLHRFFGRTQLGEEFVVQISQNKNSNKKYFLSVFPK